MDVAALVVWPVIVLGGLYMIGIWIRHGGTWDGESRSAGIPVSGGRAGSPAVSGAVAPAAGIGD